jgi:hypothetical protein
MRSRWAKVLIPAAAALMLHAGLVAVYVLRNQGDVSSLVCVSSDFAQIWPYDAVTAPMAGSGADGMWYYAIARAPLHLHPEMDFPANRHLRIAYPLLCWLVSAGEAPVLFWAMPALNLLAITGLAGLAAHIACRAGRSGWWGFLLPVAVNAAIPALRDLTDCFSTLAVLGLLASWLLGAPPLAFGGWTILALANREQNAAVVALVLLGSVATGQRRRAAAVATAAAVWGLWVVVLRLAYGTWPFLPTGGNFAPPLSGLVGACQHLATADYNRRMAVLLWGSLLHMVLVFVVAGWCVLRTRSRLVGLFVLGGLLLAILGGPSLYLDVYSYRRVFVWHTLGVWVHAVQTGDRRLAVLLAAAGTWSIAPVFGYV